VFITNKSEEMSKKGHQHFREGKMVRKMARELSEKWTNEQEMVISSTKRKKKPGPVKKNCPCPHFL
jgi:hypothetical protein